VNGLMRSVGYRDRTAALLTQHGKEQVIGPVLEAALGCRVQRVSGYDTDRLGTFTREIPRAGSQIEAARRKARIGMTLSGLSLGLASEGSFGLEPMIGMFPWNVECLIWIDDDRVLEIVGWAQGEAHFGQVLTGDWAKASTFTRRWRFPSHQMVIRPDAANDPRIRKGLAAWAELESAFVSARRESATGRVLLETDVRAHANPTRQHVIRAAADNLAARLQSACPACGAPGFWLVDRAPGLRCSDCGAPTRETLAEILGCVKCPQRISRPCTDRSEADPSRCDSCNP
jgi:hypothetical protein